VATDQALQQLCATLDKLQKVDTAKLLRKNLGDESLDTSFSPKLAEISQLGDFVRKYARAVHDDSVNQARATFENVVNLMTQQAARPPAEYIGQRETFLSQAESHLRDSQRWRPAFVCAAIEERGFLKDEGIRQEYQRTVQQLQQESAATLATVKQEADRALEGAKKLAEEIETRARKTATKISVKDAQDQFAGASSEFAKKVRGWTQAGIASTVLLVIVAGAFMWWPLPGAGTWPVALYHTLLRLFVLSVMGAVSAFSFRMLRAHMHMAEKNRHRVRVANSVESFVNSALEPQQRDLLLAKLAEAIIDFGDSGIIKGDRDEMESSVVSADMLGRILAAVTSRKP
jgi:ElaB/YqjD/DUF883 family membrane-anchored ribosome-binding protein